jgi:hypothetical protein
VMPQRPRREHLSLEEERSLAEQLSLEERQEIKDSLHKIRETVHVAVQEIAGSHGFNASKCQIGWHAGEGTVSVWAHWQEEEPVG